MRDETFIAFSIATNIPSPLPLAFHSLRRTAALSRKQLLCLGLTVYVLCETHEMGCSQSCRRHRKVTLNILPWSYSSSIVVAAAPMLFPAEKCVPLEMHRWDCCKAHLNSESFWNSL